MHEDEAKDEWRTLVAAAHTLLQARQLGEPHPLLAQLKDHLHAEADVVITAKQVLAEKLHRALAQETLPDRRLTATLLRDIRALARQAAARPPSERHFTTIETDVADIRLPLARPPQYEFFQPVACVVPGAAETAPPLDRLAGLAAEIPPVDIDRLERQLADLLALRPSVPLAEVVARYGLPQGLPELVMYLAGQTRYPVHFAEASAPETILLSATEHVRMASVLFTVA